MKRILMAMCGLLFLFCFLPLLQAAAEVSVFDALDICVKNEVGEFVSLNKVVGYWEIKAVNLNNQSECYLRINRKTGIIDFCSNVTPKDLIIGENTYGFSGERLKKNRKFYDTKTVVNGFRIYKNDSRFFIQRQAVFIENNGEFLAYLMYKGPGVIK